MQIFEMNSAFDLARVAALVLAATDEELLMTWLIMGRVNWLKVFD